MSISVEAHLASTKCQSCIAASMEFFTVDMRRVSILPENTLWNILSKCFDKFTSIFSIDDSHDVLTNPSTLERMVDAVFDTDSRAFITQNSLPMLDRLDDQAKACLLAQAVAGVILILRRLSVSGAELSHGLFSKELQLFAEREQRRRMLETIQGSHLFASCNARAQVVALLSEAINDVHDGQDDGMPLMRLGEKLTGNNDAWVSDRPCSNMGVPWGFTIMALN